MSVKGRESHEPPRLKKLLRALQRAMDRPPPKAKVAAATSRVILLSKKPIERWLVLGERGDYIVVSRHYCSCPDFTIRTVMMYRSKPCYHIVAVELARKQGKYHDLSSRLTSRKLAEIIYEVIVMRSSSQIRRLMHEEKR